MSNRILALLFFLLFAAPMTVLAMEQKFTQNNLTAMIKLGPDKPTAGNEVNLSVRLERGGQAVTDRQVTLKVYQGEGGAPLITREIEELDGDYVDSWVFEKPGDYKVVLNIADSKKPGETLTYEVNASVGSANEGKHENHENHGFFEHHFGSHWGWWGGGLMLLMMIPMMILL